MGMWVNTRLRPFIFLYSLSLSPALELIHQFCPALNSSIMPFAPIYSLPININAQYGDLLAKNPGNSVMANVFRVIMSFCLPAQDTEVFFLADSLAVKGCIAVWQLILPLVLLKSLSHSYSVFKERGVALYCPWWHIMLVAGHHRSTRLTMTTVRMYHLKLN